MVEDTNVRKGSGQFAVDQVFRSGVALGVTLPGPRVEKLAVHGISSKIVNDLNQVFVIDVANEGNVLLKSHGDFELKDAAGALVGHQDLTLDNVLPGTSVPYELFWPKESLPAGKYQASVSLIYSPSVAPASASVPDLRIEMPGLRLVAPPSGAQQSAPGAPGALAVVQQAGDRTAGAPGGGVAQTVLPGLIGAAGMGGALLAFQLVRRGRR
jgi:hypothetical protein